MVTAVLLTGHLLLLCLVRGEQDPWESEKTLRKQMFKDYDKSVRPALNVSVTVSRLTVRSLKVAWEDLRLKWRLEEHQDLDRLGVDAGDLWRPDLALYNPASLGDALSRSQLPALVYPSGEVLFAPQVSLPLHCLLDLTYWPYDVMNCSLNMGSWVHHGHMLNLSSSPDALQFEFPFSDAGGIAGDGTTQGQWQVTHANLTSEEREVPCCSEPQTHLRLVLLLQRCAPAYAWLIKTTIASLAVITCLLFLLPPARGGKIIFGGICLLADLICLAIALTLVARDPTHTPLIVQLLVHQLLLTVVSVVVAVVVVRLALGPHRLPVPALLLRHARRLSYVLCLSDYTTRAACHHHEYSVFVKSEQIELGERSGAELRGREWPEEAGPWVLLAALTDRLALLLYLAACLITILRFSAIL